MHPDPVVDRKFCVSEPTVLQIYKSCGGFHVENAADQLVFSVDKPFGCFSCVNRHILRDAKRVPLLCATRRMLDLRQRRDVYRGDQYGFPENLLFTVRRARYMSLNSANLQVFLAANGTKEAIPDYTIEVKSPSDPLKVTTRQGNVTIATACKSQTFWDWFCRGKAKFTIELEEGVDQAFIVILFMICVQIKEPDTTHV